MKILFIGDIYAQQGRKVLAGHLNRLAETTACDFIIANGENMSGGKGIDTRTADEILKLGVDAITSGNHIWAKKDFFIDEHPRVLRPANYSGKSPGKGLIFIEKGDNVLAVVNLSGRVYMDPCNCPFEAFENMLPELKARTKAILVDFHGEATSEKAAFAWHFDGNVSVVVGTHTHVQTADERILPFGTGFITDVGMTGPADGIIGADREKVIRRFVTGMPAYFEPQKGRSQINGILMEVCGKTGKCISLERIDYVED
ncbi:MAG: TIGR00282 family metallophosphoesterase [Clostridia bacterium]